MFLTTEVVMQIRYSVIVPVYNCERFIDRCIKSILSQTLTNFELILVDDGSQDLSGNICDKYEKLDSRVKVIHKNNAGVSAARNSGLDVASGEFVTFIDSDDYLDSTALQHLDSAEGDLVVNGYLLEHNDNEFKPSLRNHGNDFIDINDKTKLEQRFIKGMFNYVFSKRYDLKIINDNQLRFDESINLGEDTLFVLDYLKYIQNISVIDYTDYHYVKYSGMTLTNQIFTPKVIDRLENLHNEMYNRILFLFDKDISEALITKHIGVVYRNFIFEKILNGSEHSFNLISYLYSQKWFRLSLEYVDEIYADENKKFKFLMKTKSAILFYIYIKFFN